MEILALCATYNRRDITLAALGSLKEQALPVGVRMQIAVVDDASTDGTPEAIRKNFPDVSIIGTSGGFFWAGAMRFGFKKFWDPQKYTDLLVFNDDVILYNNAIYELINTARYSENSCGGTIVVGAMKDPETRKITYGGLIKKPYRPSIYLERVSPTGNVQSVDTLNMNLALIDKNCLSQNEFIRAGFTHSLADYDFGLRAKKKGARLLLAPEFMGECSRNQANGTWEDSSLPFIRRFSLIWHPK